MNLETGMWLRRHLFAMAVVVLNQAVPVTWFVPSAVKPQYMSPL